MRSWLTGLLVIVCAAAVVGRQSKPVFVQLFDGTMKGWVVENTTANNFTLSSGTLRVEGPSGWLRTERQFTDFIARIRFRFLTDDADSGVFFRTTGATQFIRGWPNNGYQVQLRNPATKSAFPPVGGLFRHGMPAGDLAFDQTSVGKLSRGTGEWQDLELTVTGDTLSVTFNGTEVTRAGNIVRQPGYVGLQGEVGGVEFRSIEVAALP